MQTGIKQVSWEREFICEQIWIEFMWAFYDFWASNMAAGEERYPHIWKQNNHWHVVEIKGLLICWASVLWGNRCTWKASWNRYRRFLWLGQNCYNKKSRQFPQHPKDAAVSGHATMNSALWDWSFLHLKATLNQYFVLPTITKMTV